MMPVRSANCSALLSCRVPLLLTVLHVHVSLEFVANPKRQALRLPLPGSYFVSQLCFNIFQNIEEGQVPATVYEKSCAILLSLLLPVVLQELYWSLRGSEPIGGPDDILHLCRWTVCLL